MSTDPSSTERTQLASATWNTVAAPGSDLPAALLGADRPELIVRAVGDIERVLATHDAWLRDFHLALLAPPAEPADSSDMPPPLDRSVWQSGAHLTVCRDNPLLRRTSIDIDAMIEEGRLLFAAKHRAGTVTAADYERFMASALRVGEDLRQFLGDTWNRLANIDPLTGLGNRAAMLRKLGVESERHVRNEEPCCVAILDLDHFKQINDTYGHSAGDVVLRSIASLLATSVRPYDEVFRYGGEEFVLCLPNADVRTAWAIVERLRLKVAGWAIPIRNGQQIYTTLSIGVAPLAGRGGVEAAIELADAALYAAKGNGRNCVFVRCE